MEQSAIAAALGDVDALLGGLDRLIAKKRDLKQAAMQQLLTGQTRLPGFNGEWEVKRLGEICQITTGRKDVNEGNTNGQYPFFTYPFTYPAKRQAETGVTERPWMAAGGELAMDGYMNRPESPVSACLLPPHLNAYFFTCSRTHTFSSSYSFDTEAILIAGNGEVGNLHYFSGKFEAYQRTYALTNFLISIRFIWHQLNINFVDSLGLGKVGSSIPYIKRENLTA